MKFFALIAMLLIGVSQAYAGDAPKYPAWDGKEAVADYAKRIKLDPTLTLDLGDGVKWEGVLIPAGEFLLGSPKSEVKNDAEGLAEKQHKVTISQPFYMGKYELTQAQYQKIAGNNPSKEKGDDLPVGNVTVKDALAFCEKASKQLNRTIQLPTEAQWEYACRAGTTTAYYNGGKISDLEKIAWFGANSGGKAHPVGQKAANAWGLYDMLGNIREYVADIYSEAPQEDATDPTGPKDGNADNHVVRGGAFSANAEKAGNCRCGSRRSTEGLQANGFRVMVTLPAK